MCVHATIIIKEKEAINLRVEEGNMERMYVGGLEGGKGGGSDAILFQLKYN